MAISAKVEARISSELKRYQNILRNALKRDVSESDTVLIIADMLADVFGYDKHTNITTEHAVRGTYVDLAVSVENKRRFLIEAKAIGIELKDAHVKQAVDYGANEGIEWIVLTNAAIWRIYKVVFGKPIDKTLIFEIDILNINPKDAEVVRCFGNLSRECFSKGSMTELLEEKQITGKFAVSAVLISDVILEELRRELRRLSPGLKVDTDYLRTLLLNDIIKREMIDTDEAQSALAFVKRLQRALVRKRSEDEKESESAQVVAAAVTKTKLPAADETSGPIGSKPPASP